MHQRVTLSFTPLTPDTQRLIAQDFSPEDQLAAAELLEQKCGSSLPLMGDRPPEEIERVRFAEKKRKGVGSLYSGRVESGRKRSAETSGFPDTREEKKRGRESLFGTC